MSYTVQEQPPYGWVCLSCGQIFDEPCGHYDPETDEKCRDVTGSGSVPSEVGPVAKRPWGPRGLLAEREWEESYLDG